MSFFEKFGRSAGELKKIRCITVTGVLIALDIVLKMLSIKVTNDLKITFSFLALATIGMLFGPTVSFMAGIITDIIGYMLNSEGGFSPLFTIIEAIGAMIYGFFLYDIKGVDLKWSKPFAKGKEYVLRDIVTIIISGIITGLIFAGAAFGISQVFNQFIETEGSLGKIAKVLTDPAMVYVSAVVGLLYGLIFTLIIRSNICEKSDIKRFLSVILSKVVVVVVCNLIMTPAAMVISGYSTSEAIAAGYPLRLVKNAIQCPVDCLLLIIILFPILTAYKKIFHENSGDRSVKSKQKV